MKSPILSRAFWAIHSATHVILRWWGVGAFVYLVSVSACRRFSVSVAQVVERSAKMDGKRKKVRGRVRGRDTHERISCSLSLRKA